MAALLERRAHVRARLQTPGRWSVARLRELVELDDARAALEAETRDAELEGLVGIHEALGRLRSCGTPEALIEAAPLELCRALGFTRAMISRVRGSIWDPSVLAVMPGFDPGAEDFREYIESVEIPLEHMLLETDLVRRRVPVLVRDPASDPRTFQRIVEVSRSSSYVACPIMPTRRVIGFFHADRFGDARACDEHDREGLWTFAEHFGLLFERAVLVERLEDQRSRLQRALSDAATAIDELCDAELDLVRRGTADVPAVRGSRRTASRVEGLLSSREREVLDLLALGATNAAIAQQLVVSEGTVKSHLKRIHRKLRVSNRAEAVARYLNLLRQDERPARW